MKDFIQQHSFPYGEDVAQEIKVVLASKLAEFMQNKTAIEAITLRNYKTDGIFRAEVLVRIGGKDYSVITGVSDDTIIDHTIYANGIEACLHPTSSGDASE